MPKAEVKNPVDPEVRPTIISQSIEPKIEKGSCPYCASLNFEKGEDKPKNLGSMTMERSRLQCMSCGKHWDKEDIGKPYSIELERGAAWAKEDQIRKMKHS